MYSQCFGMCTILHKIQSNSNVYRRDFAYPYAKSLLYTWEFDWILRNSIHTQCLVFLHCHAYLIQHSKSTGECVVGLKTCGGHGFESHLDHDLFFFIYDYFSLLSSLSKITKRVDYTLSCDKNRYYFQRLVAKVD